MFPRAQRHKALITAVLGLFWIVSLLCGIRSLFSYESTPGRVGRTPESWPMETGIILSKDSDTLVMLAHPHCPCTQASMAELAKIMAHTAGKLRAYVVFINPTTVSPEWGDTDLRKTASQIPGVTVLTDQGGENARRFGGKTSGHTFLFDRTGRCVFSGGITAFRGHAGDNPGESAIVAKVNGGKPASSSTLVFGCALNNERDASK